MKYSTSFFAFAAALFALPTIVVADGWKQTSSGFTCPPQDDNGSMLLSAEPSTESDVVGGLVCTYSSAGVCTFFSNGSFSSGGSTCPGSLLAPGMGMDNSSGNNNGGSSPPTGSGSGTQTSNGNTCPTVDKQGSPLQSAEQSTASDTVGGLVCTYSTAGVCTYFSNGSFSSGGSTCPGSLLSPGTDNTGSNNSGSGSAPGSGSGTQTDSGLTCPPQDKAGSALQSSEKSTESDTVGGLVCTYPTARACTYFSNGSFSSGSSDCPASITSSAASGLLSGAAAGAVTDSSSSDVGKWAPAIIGLLVANLLVLLALVTLSLLSRRNGKSVSRSMSSKYAPVGSRDAESLMPSGFRSYDHQYEKQ